MKSELRPMKNEVKNMNWKVDGLISALTSCWKKPAIDSITSPTIEIMRVAISSCLSLFFPSYVKKLLHQD